MTGARQGTNARGASVQVLTAEVRTLVVGSRQVTMSVYDQLDDIAPDEIEPFGRVSPKSKYGPFCVFTIGRDIATGALVRSYVLRQPAHMNARGWIPIGGNAHHPYQHWTGRTPTTWPELPDSRAIRELKEIAERWTILPLIVLAGLR